MKDTGANDDVELPVSAGQVEYVTLQELDVIEMERIGLPPGIGKAAAAEVNGSYPGAAVATSDIDGLVSCSAAGNEDPRLAAVAMSRVRLL